MKATRSSTTAEQMALSRAIETQRLTGGAEQLVILGAGYDSRPYRFAHLLGGVQVFEVDHPATSTAKQAKVRALIGGIPANVAYVPVDFTVDNLADKLLECGYCTTRRTVFLWEGVTPYLNLEAVDTVLSFVMASAAAGSTIVFDYILRAVVAQRTLPSGVTHVPDVTTAVLTARAARRRRPEPAARRARSG
jgi:methyltransferase (TIGR00027 family)